MNLTEKEKEVWKSYKIPGMSAQHQRPINAIYISPSNSITHETAKLEICWELRKDGIKFISECVDSNGLRRDIVTLGGQIIEIDNSKSKRGHRHGPEVTVYWYDLKKYRRRE